jgi:hypothetical protein
MGVTTDRQMTLKRGTGTTPAQKFENLNLSQSVLKVIDYSFAQARQMTRHRETEEELLGGFDTMEGTVGAATEAATMEGSHDPREGDFANYHWEFQRSNHGQQFDCL